MNLRKRYLAGKGILRSILFAMVLAGACLSLHAEAEAKTIYTKRSTLPADTPEDVVRVTINTKKGKRNFRIFGQKKATVKKDTYISVHGCAVSSLTTVLSGFSKTYRNYTPYKTCTRLEKKVLKGAWKNNYRKSLLNKMPISLYGITKVLKYAGINSTYVRASRNKTAAARIKSHLRRGKPVIIELNNHKQINGHVSRAYTSRWALSKHTVVLLGLTEKGRVIVADSAYRAWAGEDQRIKYTSAETLVKYMLPCKSSGTYSYYHSSYDSGGFILVNP